MLKLENITKAFSGVLANYRVSLDVAAGEIHALLGENGAGKSTLMNILYGLYKPDEGRIMVDGEDVDINSPRDAIKVGINMVHQHFMLVPAFTVLENIIMGLPPLRGPFLDLARARREIREKSDYFGMQVDPSMQTGDLSVGLQQRVEILKALYRQAKILVLDEPTGVLTPSEIEDLFRIVRKLASLGHAVIFVTHKLEEVRELCHRATVLRNGRNVATVDCAAISASELAVMMVGRNVVLQIDKAPWVNGPAVLQVKDLEVKNAQGVSAVRGASFAVRRGEIVGIAGIDGNGQSELVDAIAGLRSIHSGTIVLNGKDISHATVIDRFDAGLGHVPEDRQRRGLVLDFNLLNNLILRRYKEAPLAKGGFLRPSAIKKFGGQLLAEFDVRASGPLALARNLSGGNQQKLVLAREIEGRPDLLLASKPTRGLDIGATEFVRRRLLKERDRGMAILLISGDLEEIVALSDRIFVLFEGRIVGEQTGENVDTEALGLMMAGALVAH